MQIRIQRPRERATIESASGVSKCHMPTRKREVSFQRVDDERRERELIHGYVSGRAKPLGFGGWLGTRVQEWEHAIEKIILRARIEPPIEIGSGEMIGRKRKLPFGIRFAAIKSTGPAMRRKLALTLLRDAWRRI